ncbi:ABC transporter permease [Synoicihabitans lomoniglobus]|uniref:ABC transporter permease n=1 Tax=Synoicihabitans lomoniglobus TaxID=2909285 RepID=A0AAE9ZY37_9BACT|nr:ABC transporter permease [Opitutaceae bacterium LMO-M01]WED65125.1 ABC transporter permease [Opitutaceae bacterium LMO-M01]
MLTDLRLALRHLAKARGFALIATFTLAIGIGSSTAMFSTLRALVMHPFDYPESEKIVQVWSGDGWPLSPADFHDLHEQNTSFTDFGVYQPGSVNVGTERAQAVAGVRATSGVLRAFGVQPFRGRFLEPADEVEGAAPVAIVSYGLWQQTFGGTPDLVGQTVRLNSRNVTVVGIMPADFEFAAPWMRTQDCQVWTPYIWGEDEREQRDSHYLCGVARLHNGATVGSADAEIKSIGTQLTALYPDSNTRKEFLVRSLHYEMTNDVGGQVWLLFGAVALVLLVACANVASMLLARSAQRQGEFGVRVALGATRSRLVRLALTESLVLAALGATVGLAFSYGGIEVLKLIAPTSEARKAAIALDAAALLFALGATVLTTLLAGIPPALAAARTSLVGVIRSDARGAVGSRARHHMLRALIIAQIAVAFVLANGAALFSASYFKILEQNQSLSTDLVLSAKLNLRSDAYDDNEDRVRFWSKLTEHLQAIPGVTSVGLTSKLPLEGGSNTNALVNDETYDPTQRRTSVERSSVTTDYFATMGITLLQGRNLTATDDMTEDGHLGVVVNRAFVEKAWPDKSPIGEIFRANQPEDPWYTATVVGVVENVRQWSATAEPQPEMYTTPPRHWGETVHINLRSTQPASFLAPQLRAAITELDHELALENVRTLNQVVNDATAGERAVAGLVNFFMVAALGLVAVGLYGTLSYHIVQRTREIGVRMAIGAMSGDILRLVFGQGLRWVGMGIVIGIAGTFALSSLLTSVAYDMDGITALPLSLSTAAVGTAAVLATWIPAWRASRLNPIQALHMD